MVCPFFTFCPISANFFAPGSGAKYAVPTIGEVTCLPLLLITVCFFFTSVDMILELFVDLV